MHSTASDGVKTPAEVVEFAVRECGVTTLALTDHDTVAGIPEAREAAKRLGVAFIPGIEVSVEWAGRVIHIVGLGVDINAPAMLEGACSQVQKRADRAVHIGRKLESMGFEGILERTLRMAPSQNISRLHFAKSLVEMGIVKHTEEAFVRFLGAGRPAYVDPGWVTLERGVELIEEAGGMAVMAHPGRYKFPETWMMDGLIEAFVAVKPGLMRRGVEVVSGSMSPSFTPHAVEWCHKYGLLASRGSDFHSEGSHRPLPGAQGPMPDGVVSVLDTLNALGKVIR